MLLHYLKVAVRQLLKYRTQNLISIVGLGVCLLCFSICLYVGRFILDTDSCFEHRDRIAELRLVQQGGRVFAGTPAPLVSRLRQMQWDEVEALTYVAYPGQRSFDVEAKEGEMFPFAPLTCMEVDSCFRQVFGARIVAGTWQAAARTPNAVVLAESTARRLFGSNPADAIGRRLVTTLKLPYSSRRGGVAYTVQAVMEDLPLNNSLNFMDTLDLLVLNDSDGLLQWEGNADMTGGFTYALLHRGGTDLSRLEDSFRQAGITYTLYGEEYDVSACPLGKSFWDYSIATYMLGVVLVLGTLVLLVGLLNFFYFQIGAFLHRSREYSLRRVLGGDTRQLTVQLFVQAALVVVLAFLLTFCLIELLTPLMHFALLEWEMEIDPAVLNTQCAQYLAGVLVLSLAACALTALRARHADTQSALRGGNRHRIRTAMLGIQYFICWVFVTLAAALYLQADTTTSTLFGTLTRREKADILSISLDYSFLKNADKLALVERMKQHAGVEDCLTADIAYTRGISGNQLLTAPPDDENRREINVDLLSVPQNFFDFMHIPLLKGHAPAHSGEIVVDQLFEDGMQAERHESLMGTTFFDYRGGYTVCGVCAPLVTNVYRRGRQPGYFRGFAFLPSAPDSYLSHCYLKCHPGQTDEVRRYVTGLLTEALPYTIRPEVGTLLDDLEEMQGLESKLKGVVLFLAVVCVILTLLGVYAAITLDTERRRKEVAIRKVNGAGRRQIFLLFARTYGWIWGITFAIAGPLLYAVLQQWKQMYAVFFQDGPLFWLGIGLFVLLVTVLTVVFRIRKIARLNPAEAIKTE